MKLEIKISKKTNESVHQGKMIFSHEGDTVVHFSITDNELLKIHNNALLLNAQTSTNENIYHETFETKTTGQLVNPEINK